jgi:hypothetical protein
MDNQQAKSSDQEPQKEMSREEIIKWYDDQIEIAEKRHKLTTLQSETVQAEALRLEALAVIARFRGRSPQEQNDGEGGEPKSEDKE